MKRYLGLSTWLAALLLLAACGANEDNIGETESGSLALGSAEVEERVERSALVTGRTLVLEGFSGRVALEGDSAETARLTFVKQGRGENDADAREVARGIAIQESGTEAEYVYSVGSGESDRARVAVEGRVPRSMRTRINMESGAVRLSGVLGPLDVQTSGPIEAAGVAQQVNLTTRTGDLLLGLRRLSPEAESRLETNNGDITVVIPPGTSMQVEAQTGAGEIRVEGLSFTNRQLNPEGAGAQFQGQLNGGNASLELQTQNGNIVLRQGTLYTLPSEREASADGGSSTQEGGTSWPVDSVSPPAEEPPLDTLRRPITPPFVPDTSQQDTSAQETI